jgi:hypothetical protein
MVTYNLKLAQAINEGLKIVHTDWIEESGEAGELQKVDKYPLISKTDYNLSVIAKKRKPLLDGMTVWIGSKVKPLRNSWEQAITAAGGKLASVIPKKLSENILIVSTNSDIANNAKLRDLGFTIYEATWMLHYLITHQRLNKHYL